MENFERKYAPIELWSYFIDILAFELGKLCPGVGILFRFFKKLVAQQSAQGRGGGGGMVTGQIDTCITATKKLTYKNLQADFIKKLYPNISLK